MDRVEVVEVSASPWAEMCKRNWAQRPWAEGPNVKEDGMPMSGEVQSEDWAMAHMGGSF